MTTGAQIRHARELLGWTPAKLALRARLPSAIVRRAESVEGKPPITAYHEALIRAALQDAGLEFTSGGTPGVTLKRSAEAQ